MLKLLKNWLLQSTSLLTINPHILLPFVLFIILLPHLVAISIIVTLYILLILAWFLLHTLGIISKPGQWIRFFLVLIALVILVISYGLSFSQTASLSLLSIMMCLKLFEIDNEQDRRNIFLVIFIADFILISYFLHSQDIFLGIFIVVNIFILTLMLNAFNRLPQSSLSLMKNLLLISHIFVKALPIAIILFLFFPRIPGPLWTLPEFGQSGTTGLSDKMYPGSITSLVDSDEIAFRVSFQGSSPSAEDLYWRGPVLTETDGFLWSQKKQQPLIKPFSSIISETSGLIHYTVTLEAHQNKMLFALEMPTQVKGDTIQGAYLSTDLQMLTKNSLHQLTQYQVISSTHFKFNTVSDSELKDALQFPQASNPRTHQLGQSWKSSLSEPQKIVAAGLNYFKNEPFYYTKRPDAMTTNPSDEFLFDKKRGFCEHFASSFVLLMRAAGVPARVVTGYQGIERNDVGNYYIVRQSNAHAWAEVWLDKNNSGKTGWVRIDPTAMIPAERIEADIFQTYLDRLRFSSLNIPDLPELSAQQKTLIYNVYNQLKQIIDNIRHSWNNWVLGYDQSKQNILLALMGMNANAQTLIVLMISCLAGLVIIFQISERYKKYQKRDKVLKSYLKFIDKLNQSGLAITPNEGPEAIKQYAIRQFPQYKTAIQDIINDYITIRYAEQGNKELILSFQTQVKQFKLR